MDIKDLMLKDTAGKLKEKGKLANMAKDLADQKDWSVDSKNLSATKGARYEKGYQVRGDQTYDKKALRRTAAQAYEKQTKSGLDARMEKTEMLMAAQSLSKEGYARMQEEGFDPRHKDPKEFVTIADKIRMQLAKAGVDVSITGGIKSDTVEAMTGSAAEAAGVEQKLKEEGLPAEKEMIESAETVLEKAEQLPRELPQEAIRYLIANEMEPTADQVFTAVFAGGVVAKEAGISEEDFAALLPQIEETIENAGFVVDEKQLQNAKWLLDQSLPLTEENLKELASMKDTLLRTETEDVILAIVDAVKEGQSPSDAMLLPGRSMMDQARESMDVIAQSTDETADLAAALSKDGQITIQDLRQALDQEKQTSRPPENITARRQLEEIRLMMTTEANFKLIRQGMEIDTTPLSDLVEGLKAKEEEERITLFGEDKVGTELFEKTEQRMTDLQRAPAALIASYRSIEQFSQIAVGKLAEDGQKLAAKYAKAGERYETMGTEVRKDLGDSIQKAFGNVDDIIKDLGLEVNEANERAVRILGYNSREITEESIAMVKAADEQVARVFKGMTPAVVMDMIKKGENPLELSMKELEQKIRQITEESHSVQSADQKGDTSQEKNRGDSQKDAEDFAEFLWKAEQTHSITSEERESYIGLYRLMYQVDRTDGAAIGALLYQGADLTMTNLMTAVKTARHEGREYEISDEKGAVSIGEEGLTIMQQAIKAFETGRMRDAKDVVTPAKLSEIGGEEAYLAMTPDQLATALEEAEGDQEIEAALAKENTEQIRRTIEEAAEESAQILEDAGVAPSPANLEAVHQMLRQHRNFFTGLFGSEGRKTFASLEESLFSGADTLDTAFDQLVEDFGEACKTPEEMAKAQEKLAETAENVLRKALADDAASGSIDIKGIQQSVRAIQVMKELAEKKETYAVPVMVADKLGKLTLKIVRGKEEDKGLVDIAFDSEETGALRAQFKTDVQGGIIGRIRLSQAAMRQAFSEQLPQIAGRIQEELGGGSVSLLAEYDGRTEINSIFRDAVADFEVTEDKTSPVQTKTLYGVAKGFIESLSEMF
ncbi:MAG: hypothetical protein II080_05170 [Lachnospiraceae bacterium]|nr:hypothetical protein [Lachnospiraceae bacterium]